MVVDVEYTGVFPELTKTSTGGPSATAGELARPGVGIDLSCNFVRVRGKGIMVSEVEYGTVL